MKIKFLSLASGSSGNCYYLGTDTYGILIDAGIGVRTIKKHLKEYGLALERVLAVFVTHDHADHIKSLGVISSKANIPVYATREVHEGITKNYCVSKTIEPTYVRYITKEESITLRDFVITPFEVPHDGSDNVGYFIEVGDKKFCIATDLGEITPVVSYYVDQANYLVIESNYEDQMLAMGRYPEFLKMRVSSARGHLSNQATAKYLASHFNEHLKYIWLCHLSEENNHPELAYKAVAMEFGDYGIIPGKDVQLIVLKRTVPSQLYHL